jgi:hypothetical protein
LSSSRPPLAGIDIMTKHANGTDPGTGQLAGAPGSTITGAGAAMETNDTQFPVADYADTAQNYGG